MPDKKPSCFIIMPISTPKDKIELYQKDELHFLHILEHLFIPAIEEAGFESISPKSTGSNIIQADIINNLSNCDLVLCDMSNLNPNVFFEFGIRTALDKPVALVVDDLTTSLPFDTSIINFHKYNHRLETWIAKEEIPKLVSHISEAYQKSKDRNSLWKYFGIKQAGNYSPENVELGEKLDFIMAEISTLKQNSQFSDQNLQNIEGEKRLNTKLIDELQMDLNILNKKKEEIEVKLINSGMKQEESKGPVSESNHQEINRLISELKHINNIRSELIDKMNIYKMITERPY